MNANTKLLQEITARVRARRVKELPFSFKCAQCSESFDTSNPAAHCCLDCYELHEKDCEASSCCVIQGGQP